MTFLTNELSSPDIAFDTTKGKAPTSQSVSQYIFLPHELRLSRNHCWTAKKKFRLACASNFCFQRSWMLFWVGVLIAFISNEIGNKLKNHFGIAKKGRTFLHQHMMNPRDAGTFPDSIFQLPCCQTKSVSQKSFL